MYFTVRWPDGQEQRCYSPSLVVADYLEPGQSYQLREFLALSREALEAGSERVRLKYGFGCGRALVQIEEIAGAAAHFNGEADVVVVEGFDR